MLTTKDRRIVDGMFKQVDLMIGLIGDHHMNGDYVGASLEAVERLQEYVEQRRKELAGEAE